MGERKDLRDLLKDKDFTQKRIIDDLASSDAEADYPRREVSGDIRRSDGGDFIKNFFIGILLVAIVVGSFWASFLIGKKVLVPPVRNFPALETPAPKAISKIDLDKATPVDEESALDEKDVNDATTKADLPKPVTPKKILGARTISSSESGKVALGTGKIVSVKAAVKTPGKTPTVKTKGPKLFKVIVGTFRSAGDANSFVRSLKEKGFIAYVKEISGRYRVQAGAFDSREKAKPLVVKLKNKGITPSVIAE